MQTTKHFGINQSNWRSYSLCQMNSYLNKGIISQKVYDWFYNEWVKNPTGFASCHCNVCCNVCKESANENRSRG